MILFQSSVLRLDYDPATDILEAGYPDLHDFLLPEIRHGIDRLVDVVRHYDIRRVLLDSTRTAVSVPDEKSREVTTCLMGTRVEKVARVRSASAAVEAMAQGNMRHVRETLPLPFQLQNFTDRAAARAWLAGRVGSPQG